MQHFNLSQVIKELLFQDPKHIIRFIPIKGNYESLRVNIQLPFLV